MPARDTRDLEASMLPAVVSVVVMLATGDPGDGSTRAIERSLHAALGSDASVSLRTSGVPASDEALVATAKGEHATLLAVVSWEERQRRVTIRFLEPAAERWSEREITFDAADAPSERGRTVGFALASMVSDEALATKPAPRAESAPPRAEAATQAPPPHAARPDAPRARRREHPNAIDASAVATTGVGGYGGGVGGTLAYRLTLAGQLAARIAFGARAGEVAPAQATSRMLGGALGLAWQPWLDRGHRWAAGPRLSALLLRHELVHLSEDDPGPDHRARFLPGLDAALEGSLHVLDYASLIAAAGAEVAFGETDVYVHDRRVATLPALRLFGEVGFRVGF